MRYKIKALKKDTPEEVAIYRKLGLVFKTNHSFLNEHNVIDGLRYIEREFCASQKIDTIRYKRYKEIYKHGGKGSLMGAFRKHRVLKPRSNEIIEFIDKFLESSK
ncbi:hypothetical protein H311_02260 [Anncaliia algerae PRA109]|nr:hypothetical protein H311_03151 [Anncaliia algerae PRA109]KCZ76737.1 hypothetical protein H311_02260 [Anncaliia algerae PRA109]